MCGSATFFKCSSLTLLDTPSEWMEVKCGVYARVTHAPPFSWQKRNVPGATHAPPSTLTLRPLPVRHSPGSRDTEVRLWLFCHTDAAAGVRRRRGFGFGTVAVKLQTLLNMYLRDCQAPAVCYMTCFTLWERENASLGDSVLHSCCSAHND